MSNAMRRDRAAKSELYLGRKRFLELNSQLQETYAHLDSAISQALRMTASMVDTAHEIGLEPEKAQKLLRKLGAFNNNVLDSRDELISAHLEATKIRMRTDQAVTSEGCFPSPFEGQRSDTLKVVA